MKHLYTAFAYMNFQDIKFIISQCSHGTTLLRAFQNLDFKNKVEVSKKTIDLGAKDSLYAYHQLIQKSSDTKMTYTDLHPKNEGILIPAHVVSANYLDGAGPVKRVKGSGY